MTHASLASPLTRGLWVIGLAGLAVITCVHPGATRMYAWPWSLAFAAALLAPTLLVVLRAFSAQRPLVLPSTAWLVLTFAGGTFILLSAFASPHRGPALLWSAPLLAGLAWFLAFFDWLHAGAAGTTAASRSRRLLTFLTLFLGLAVLVGFAQWLALLFAHGLGSGYQNRNDYPLGHSTYTAGLALLLLPCAAAVAWQNRGLARVVGLAAALLALASVFSSGSRGGMLGLAALFAAAGLLAPIPWKKKLPLAALLLVGALALAIAHPRIRAMLASDPAAKIDESNRQRTAMIDAGVRMGLDRPLLGWGPGTTPLVYPRYRALLQGGTETILQLHSAPIHLWAEHGALGLACALAALVLALQNRHHAPAASLLLVGYGTFALTDWQLDVPVFTVTLAAAAALLAGPPRPAHTPAIPRATGFFSLLALACVALFGKPDPTPELNVRALALPPSERDQAIALLRESLALNPYQELPHTNLGWLLVKSDPAAAARHFQAAARFVPDKGRIYFGLGLAALNQGNPDAAARALALECLNDPAFLSSPCWRDAPIAALRERTIAAFLALCQRATAHVPAGSWAAAQLARLAAAAPAALGRVPAGPERPVRIERPGYPVLARNLDLPAPLDVFIGRELVPPADAPTDGEPDPASALPSKGWLPTPLLLTLLDEYVSATP